MKRYLYQFTFYSGFYGSVFYKQTIALNEIDVITELVSFFMEYEEAKAKEFLSDSLGKD